MRIRKTFEFKLNEDCSNWKFVCFKMNTPEKKLQKVTRDNGENKLISFLFICFFLVPPKLAVGSQNIVLKLQMLHPYFYPHPIKNIHMVFHSE